jgi:hypothetical protein
MNFDVNLFFQGVGDVQKYNYTRESLEGMGGLANQTTTVLERWTPANPSRTMPRAEYNNRTNLARLSDRYVENAGYLRLRNLQIGYTVPKPLLAKTGFIQGIRIYATGVNLFTLTDWSGLDPEGDAVSNNSSGLRPRDNVPLTRQFLFGINASF